MSEYTNNPRDACTGFEVVTKYSGKGDRYNVTPGQEFSCFLLPVKNRGCLEKVTRVYWARYEHEQPLARGPVGSDGMTKNTRGTWPQWGYVFLC